MFNTPDIKTTTTDPTLSTEFIPSHGHSKVTPNIDPGLKEDEVDFKRIE